MQGDGRPGLFFVIKYNRKVKFFYILTVFGKLPGPVDLIVQIYSPVGGRSERVIFGSDSIRRHSIKCPIGESTSWKAAKILSMISHENRINQL